MPCRDARDVGGDGDMGQARPVRRGARLARVSGSRSGAAVKGGRDAAINGRNVATLARSRALGFGKDLEASRPAKRTLDGRAATPRCGRGWCPLSSVRAWHLAGPVRFIASPAGAIPARAASGPARRPAPREGVIRRRGRRPCRRRCAGTARGARPGRGVRPRGRSPRRPRRRAGRSRGPACATPRRRGSSGAGRRAS